MVLTFYFPGEVLRSEVSRGTGLWRVFIVSERFLQWQFFWKGFHNLFKISESDFWFFKIVFISSKYIIIVFEFAAEIQSGWTILKQKQTSLWFPISIPPSFWDRILFWRPIESVEVVFVVFQTINCLVWASYPTQEGTCLVFHLSRVLPRIFVGD